MELYWNKSINGERYRCPICNTWYPKDDISRAGGACPNCGFHENGGLKPESKGPEYDCKKCLHEDVCNLWHEHERQDASSYQLDGCDYYKDKSRYICVDDINGPGPCPCGPEGESGRQDGFFSDLFAIINNWSKEAAQCGDASGRGNG